MDKRRRQKRNLGLVYISLSVLYFVPTYIQMQATPGIIAAMFYYLGVFLMLRGLNDVLGEK